VAESSNNPDGFDGAVSGLNLPDVIQLNVQNGYSGRLTVQYGSELGNLFFRDGLIVHAECGSHEGEEAFQDILDWPTGRFDLVPSALPERITIQKQWQHLLLDTHRVLDERRQQREVESRSRPLPPDPAAKSPAGNPGTTPSAVLDRIRRVQGVVHPVLQGKDGAWIGERSYEAEMVAAQGLFLAMIGQALGTVFSAGPVVSASVQGSAQHLLLFAAKQHYLTVLIQGDSQLGAVESEIRRTLGGSR
jgi:predicted regulator of Ras-like GTPase activity (Roadblock/LC7/MglB family)